MSARRSNIRQRAKALAEAIQAKVDTLPPLTAEVRERVLAILKPNPLGASSNENGARR